MSYAVDTAIPRADRGSRVFMTADWTNVVLINYAVPQSLLERHLLPGCVLDTPPGNEGLHILSMVAMNFGEARVAGMPVPGGKHFSELNLRFYVRQGHRHGVIFLRQYVPHWTLVLGARATYNQPYHRAEISHEVLQEPELIRATTRIRYRKVHGEIDIAAINRPFLPPETSLEHFYKERYWGFDRDVFGRSYCFRVQRPPWRIFPVERATADVNPGQLLGGEWRWVDWERARHSVIFAEGSPAIVFWPSYSNAHELRGH
jgi:uncharacterized protein